MKRVSSPGHVFGRHFQSPRGTDEMRRLFYVAMTRAMSELVFVYDAADPPPFVSTAQI